MEPHGQAPFPQEQHDQARAAELIFNVIRCLVLWLVQVSG